ncbi:MAG: thioredoxin domain protein [Acidobacteria bacterium]|nr:thioredoxin domain protein [Acidobacteriota bacterium]
MFSRSILPTLLLLLAAARPGAAQATTTPPPTPAPAAAAAGIEWLDLVPGTIRRALAEDRLLLLVLDVPWSEAAKVASETIFTDARVIDAVRAGYLPVRLRADIHPDVRARYPAEAWPDINILMPDGTPLFFSPKDGQGEPRRMTATLLRPEAMAQLLDEARVYYEVEGARAVEIARKQVAQIKDTARPTPGKIEEPMVQGIATQLQSTFDPEARYFGGPPRLPRFDLVEFMIAFGAERGDPWRTMGTASLETLASKLTDPADGALYRMASGLDWSEPQKEKLLDRNGRLLELQTLAFRVTGRRSARDQALKTAAFLTGSLGNPDGSFAAALCAACPGGRDATVLSGANAVAAAALMRAGAALAEPALVERGLAAATFLKERRWRAGRGVARAVVDGEGVLTLYLEDLAETALAFISAYEVTGQRAWLDAATDIAKVAVSNLRDAGTGALADRVADPAAPGLLRFPLFPLEANSHMARSLVRLFWLTGERRYADAARDILKAFAESYRRAALLMPSYGLAAYEYHYPPIRVVVTARAGDAAGDALRRAALGAEFPFVTVLTLDPAIDAERMRSVGLTITPGAGLIALHGGEESPRLTDPAAVRGSLAALRERAVAARSAKPPEPPKADTGRPGIPR